MESNNLRNSGLVLPKKYTASESSKAIVISHEGEESNDNVIVPNFVRLSPRKNEVYDDSDDIKTDPTSTSEGSLASDRDNYQSSTFSSSTTAAEAEKLKQISNITLSKKYISSDNLKSLVFERNLNTEEGGSSDEVAMPPPNFVRFTPRKPE